jgi:hypothetical protein
MATKKPAAPAAAPAKKPTTALVAWKARLAAAAQKELKAERVTSGIPTVSTRGGVLSIDGSPVKGGELQVIVLAAVHVNTYYPDRFDPDNKQAPACYAFGDPEADDPESEMVPHDEAEDAQASRCAECPMNIMGSADTGRGKACKNIRRLAVIDASEIDDGPAGVKDAEVRLLNVPVTSVRNWSRYTHTVAEELELPTFAVATNVSCAPDPKTQYKVLFELDHAVEMDDALFNALDAKRAEVVKLMTAPYPKNEDLQKAQPMKPVGRVAQKAVVKAPVKAGRKF